MRFRGVEAVVGGFSARVGAVRCVGIRRWRVGCGLRALGVCSRAQAVRLGLGRVVCRMRVRFVSRGQR